MGFSRNYFFLPSQKEEIPFFNMKFPSFKWIVLIAFLLTLCYLNNRYEIFALNIPKGQDNEKAEGSFRVMTWNVNATMGTEDVEYVRNGLIAEIEKQDPDILCFQELSLIIFKQIQNSLDSIFGYTDSMVIKREPSRFRLYSKKPIRNFKQYKCETEIDVTGFDSLHLEEIKKLKKGMPVYSAEVEVQPGQWITVFNCHLRSSAYSTARRSMEEGSSWSDGISLYLDNYKIGKKIRDYEANNLRIFLDTLEAVDTPIIIAGDFNDWSGSYSLSTIRDGKYKDAWWNGGLGLGITYDEWHLKLRLDHILFSQHFDYYIVEVDDNSISDHYPLFVDFELR